MSGIRGPSFCDPFTYIYTWHRTRDLFAVANLLDEVLYKYQHQRCFVYIIFAVVNSVHNRSTCPEFIVPVSKPAANVKRVGRGIFIGPYTSIGRSLSHIILYWCTSTVFALITILSFSSQVDGRSCAHTFSRFHQFCHFPRQTRPSDIFRYCMFCWKKNASKSAENCIRVDLQMSPLSVVESTNRHSRPVIGGGSWSVKHVAHGLKSRKFVPE